MLPKEPFITNYRYICKHKVAKVKAYTIKLYLPFPTSPSMLAEEINGDGTDAGLVAKDVGELNPVPPRVLAGLPVTD